MVHAFAFAALYVATSKPRTWAGVTFSNETAAGAIGAFLDAVFRNGK